jgi:hypothetical protein
MHARERLYLRVIYICEHLRLRKKYAGKWFYVCKKSIFIKKYTYQRSISTNEVHLIGVHLIRVYPLYVGYRTRTLATRQQWSLGVTYKDTGVCRSTYWSLLEPEAIWI